MLKRNNDLTEIRIMAKTVKGGPFRVDTGAGNGRAVRLATLDAARSYAELFDSDKLTVMIDRPLPTDAAFSRPAGRPPR